MSTKTVVTKKKPVTKNPAPSAPPRVFDYSSGAPLDGTATDELVRASRGWLAAGGDRAGKSAPRAVHVDGAWCLAVTDCGQAVYVVEGDDPGLLSLPTPSQRGTLANVHPEDIRDHFRDARDATARALALLVYIDKLRRENDDKRNGEMIGWLTQDVHDALGEAHHAACTGLLNSGASHEYETEAEAMRREAK